MQSWWNRKEKCPNTLQRKLPKPRLVSYLPGHPSLCCITLMTHGSYDPSLCQRIWDFRNLLICQMIQCALKTCGAGKLGLFAVNFGTFILQMNRKVMESLAFPLARSRLNGTSWHNYLRWTLPLYSGRINTLPRDDWHCCGGWPVANDVHRLSIQKGKARRAAKRWIETVRLKIPKWLRIQWFTSYGSLSCFILLLRVRECKLHRSHSSIVLSQKLAKDVSRCFKSKSQSLEQNQNL